MKKKALSLVFALVMCLGLMAVPALAAPEQNVVHASNEKELAQALYNSNTTVILEDKTYTLDDYLWLDDLENITIKGTGSTRIILNNGDDNLFYLDNCKNFTFDGLIMGHDLAPGDYGCTAGVIHTTDSSITILNCDIFGCGLFGINMSGGSVDMRNSVIRDCSEKIMYLGASDATFQNCVFSGNGYALDTPNDEIGVGVYYNPSVNKEFNNTISFDTCTFTDNKTGYFLGTRVYTRDSNQNLKIEIVDVPYEMKNCQFHNNGWSDPADTGPIQSQQPGQPEHPIGTQAAPTNDALTADGEVQDPTVYKIDGSNYFKIRDLAAILNGTEKQFTVGYDSEKNSVTATTGQGYDKLDTDLVGAPAGAEIAQISNDAIYVNGEKVEAQVYKIAGSNYFKLRDLGKALDFYVGWTQEKGMFIETDKPYSE